MKSKQFTGTNYEEVKKEADSFTWCLIQENLTPIKTIESSTDNKHSITVCITVYYKE